MVDLDEYLGNLRALLRAEPARWRLVVERQILARVLPQLAGPRAALEGGLWQLLCFCLDGHDAVAPALDPPTVARATAAAENGRRIDGAAPAAFPRAATAVAAALAELQQHGVYPPPTLNR